MDRWVGVGVVRSVTNRCVGMVRWFVFSVGSIVNIIRCSINIPYIYIYHNFLLFHASVLTLHLCSLFCFLRIHYNNSMKRTFYLQSIIVA
jgi:hypothetical protein